MIFKMLTIAASTMMVNARKDPLSVQPGFKYDTVNFEQKWYENMTLDHFNDSETRTFKSRYWVNDQYFDKDEGPIFLYICGEWVCAPPAVAHSSAFTSGAQLGSRLVALEHRYYGQSQPFTNEQGGWSYENLKWLSAKQSLADINQFISSMNEELGGKRQWVVIGGSYPGALSAWFKHLYPDAAVASWSSSGVINAIEDFQNFDYDIAETTNQDGQQCSDEIPAATKKVEKLFEDRDSDEFKAMMKQFGNTNLDIELGDFMFFIADIFTMGVQYGTRTEMCQLLMGKSFQQDVIGELAKYAKTKGVVTSDYDAKFLADTTMNDDQIVRQWTYQYCTEFGWFQTPNKKQPMRSQSLTEPFWTDFCKRIYGQNIPAPAITDSNEYFGGLEITGKNIFFLTASEDPWQYAGMRKIHNPDTQKDMAAYHIECVDCGHCIDLHGPSENDPAQLTEGRKQVTTKIVQWLKEDLAERKTEKTEETKFMQE